MLEFGVEAVLLHECLEAVDLLLLGLDLLVQLALSLAKSLYAASEALVAPRETSDSLLDGFGKSDPGSILLVLLVSSPLLTKSLLDLP